MMLYVQQNHGKKLRYFYRSMQDMEDCAQVANYGEHEVETNYETHEDEQWDFACICPACPPLSMLNQSSDKGLPDDHRDFKVCFGKTGSAVSVIKARRPKSVLLEEIPQFATLQDSTGRTGLERLAEELFSIKVHGRRYYKAFAYVKIDTSNWGDDIPSRERCVAFQCTDRTVSHPSRRRLPSDTSKDVLVATGSP